MSRTWNAARAACTAAAAVVLLSTSVSASPEHVLVQKVTKNQVIVVRSNGATYSIDKGLGCLSLPQYVGRHIVVDSPGRFLGVGSRLMIPEAGQDCQVWKAQELKPAKKTPDIQKGRTRV